MSNLAKLEFAALDISGNNYLPWTLDAKIHLTAKSLGATIQDDNNTTEQDKAKAMIFLRHHLHEDLKREYLTVEDPMELWKNINERFDHQKTVILPTARYDWLHLRLQDFKTVSEYNSALFRITSELKLCGEKITEEDMLEKTFSTFHASNMLLSQQYRERKFKKYSELIACLLVAEQNDKLLLKNHQSRPVGSSPLPEANAVDHQSGQGGGRGRAPNRGRGRGRGRGYHNTWTRDSNSHKSSEGESSQSNRGRPPRGHYNGPRNTSCKKCGMTNHWANTCRTPKHLVEAYQYMLKGKEKIVETNMVEETPDLPVPPPIVDHQLDACDFIENVRDI